MVVVEGGRAVVLYYRVCVAVRALLCVCDICVSHTIYDCMDCRWLEAVKHIRGSMPT